uniref:Uncharacterized protein n=1 Tax=Cyprinus carpio carpio TaxID=630221 RepID=A0A9J8BU02_CYPCA
MAYPVDILTNVDYETLELTAEEYMSQLPYRNTEYFSLSDSKQIEIGLCNVSFVPLYGADTEKKLLALFSPDNSNTVVGLYLLDRWWRVEDVLKTAEPSRTGLNKVSTLGERIVLYVLNRIVLRNEKSSEDVFFLCHCEHEAAKILWKDGEAIGFYSFKPKGSLCRNFLTQCYLLPVMDTVFVRKCHRGQGHAIKILEDFVGSFRNEYIGLKFPLSEAMYKVCEKYFSIYPEDKELLWEVEKIGSPFQRTLIANRLQKSKLKGKDQVVSKLDFDEDDATAPMEIEITKIQETTEHTVEIVEETIIDITKEVDDIPVTRRGRGSNLKRRAIRENSEERLSENIIRVEDIEAGVESSVEVAAVENLNTFSVKESETVLRSSVDTVTATVTNFAEFRGPQKEEMHDIEKDIVTATSEGSPVTHLTTAGEIKNQRSSKKECEMVIKEYTIDIQGATIGSIEQNQLQSVVDVEIVKMSTGTEEEKNENLGKNKEVEEDESVCEAEMEEIKQMPDKPREEKTVSETEVPEQSETHAKSTEKVQAHWDMEITENKERAEDEVMAESEKDLIEENRDDNTGQEKTKSKDEDTVLQSVVVEDQIEMEADSVREVLTTEEVLCDQPKQNEAETEVSEPNQTMSNKDTLIEKASKHKLGPDEAEQVFNKSRLPQKRSSGLTPSRRSKRLRHEPAEKDLTTTKSVKTGQQGSKHHSKVMMQDEDIEQSPDEPKAESEVEEYKEKDMPTVETVSSMDVEITQVEETVFPEVSKLVERKETDPEKAPLQSSVEPPEIQESKTTPEEDDETVENSTVMLTLSEAKVVLVDLHELSSKEAGDNHGEISIPEQEEMKLTMSSELQATEENMRKEEQDGTLDTKPMEEPACTTTTEGYVVAADANRTPDQSAAYKDQENEPESETTEVVLLSQVEKPEKTDTEQDKEDKQDLYEADNFPKQGKQTQKKGSIDIPSRSTRLKDQSVDPGQTVRCLRSTLKPVKITPVRRSARSKAVIQQMESVEPQVDAKLRTDDNPERDELIAEDVSPEENEMANTNAEEIASVECGSSEPLRAAEIDDKEKEPQITKVTEEIPLIETEAKEDVLENRVEDIKNIENKEANLAGQLDSNTEMSSLAQEVYVQEEEVPISTERHLRRRTIRVQTPLTRKSRCIKKQKAEADVEHQERHTVMSKNKTDTILMTKEREDEMDQDVNKMENKEEHFAELEPVEEQNISRNEYEKTSAITEETVDACIPIFTTEASLESLDEIVNTNTEETTVPESPGLTLGVEIHDQEKRFQIVDGPEEKVSLVEPGKEVENGDGTPVIKLQRATVVLVDLSKLSQNTEGEVEASEDLTHFQMEEKLELYDLDKSEQEPSNLALEEEEQEEVQTQEDTEKTPEEEKMEEENTVEEQNKLDKQDMTFEEQKPTEDLATMPAEGSLVESNKIENKQNEDEGVSGLAQENPVQENLEEEAPVSTQRSLRRRTKRVPSPPRRKSRRIQKQGADVPEDKTEIFLITEKEADEVDQGVEIVDKEKVPQTSIVDTTEEVIPLVEAEPEDNVVEKGVEEINKLENKEANLAVTRDTGEETSEVEEEATLEQQQNEALVKNDKETAETETSVVFAPVVGREQIFIEGGTTIQIEKEVSQVTLVEAEPGEQVEKDNGSPVIQLQKATVVLEDLSKLAQNTEGESDTPEVLTHSQTEEILEQDKPDNSESQLCNLTSEEEEQLEQLQKEEDTEKTPEKDKMEDGNTVEEQNEPDKQDMTFEQQKSTEDLEKHNDLKVTEIVEVYRALDEDVEEAVNSGEHPEKTTTMADETNISLEAEKDCNISFKKMQTDSDIEMSALAQEAPETDQEVLEEEASVSTERCLRRRTIKIQSPPRRKSRRLQKQEAEAFEDKTRNIPIRGKVVDEMQETLKKSTVEATEVIPFVEAEPEDNVAEKGVEEINKIEDKETNLAVTKDSDEKTPEVEEKANLEQQQNEPLVKNDKETTETEKSMEIDPVVGKEQTFIVGGTTIQIEKEVSRVSLVEAELDEEEVKDDGTPVMLQKDTLLLVDLNKLSQTTEEQTDTQDVLTHFHTEEQLELYEPDKNDYQLCNLISEEDQQDMTVEGQKPTDDLVGQNDVKERENEEECKMVIVEDVEESVKSGEHPKATTVEGNTNIIQETENNQDISLKEKQMNSGLEMRSLGQEAPKAVQEVLEEEASISTERNLRRRTVKIQSPSIKKSRRAQRKEAEVFEDKTVTVQLTGKGDEEVHKEGAEIDQEETLQKTTVEATENIVSLIERETDENIIKKGFEIINNMENKETNLGNEATHEMERNKVNLEQQENELSVENEKETAETGKPMGMDEVSVVNKEQTYVLEETPIKAEEEILQVESSETNKNKSERTTRRSPMISSQSVPSTQKTRKSARLNKSELEPIKDAEMSRNEETSSMTAKTVNVCLPVTVETNVEYLDGDREDRDVSKRVETTSDEQDQDISNEKGRVDEAEISTDVEDENLTLIEITENDIWLEMDKMQKDVEGGVQEEEKAEPSQENTEQEKEEAVSLGENVGETDLTNVFKTTAVEEMVAFENSDQEAAFITRSLRYRTVTVQSTPRSKSKRFHRQELESERQTDHLNAPIGKENEALIAEASTAEFENLETKEGEGIIQTNTDGKSENSETKDDTKEKGNEILFEIMESNSGSQVNTEQNKTQEENLEREDMSMLNEQEEEEVSSVQKEAKPLQERENEGAAEGVQGSSADLEETTVERRSLRKRMTVETDAPRKSKRLHKQEHDDDSEQVKEAVMGQTDSVEVTFTEDSVELRSDATAAVFEGNNLGEEILQKIQKNGTKSDGECNVHKDTEPGAGESQEEQKQSRLNKTQTDEDKEEVMTDEIIEEVIEQHVDLESSTNEGFTLALEVEGTSDQEENKADEQSGVGMEAQKEISPSAQKCEKGEENISEDDEKGLAIGKHVLQSSSTTASPKRKSMRLQMHESKKKEDESDSESEVQQSSKQRHQRKRKAITDSASARRSKRHVRARIV